MNAYVLHTSYSTYTGADAELAGRIANVSILMPTN
jgi:hypothetical protein